MAGQKKLYRAITALQRSPASAPITPANSAPSKSTIQGAVLRGLNDIAKDVLMRDALAVAYAQLRESTLDILTGSAKIAVQNLFKEVSNSARAAVDDAVAKYLPIAAYGTDVST